MIVVNGRQNFFKEKVENGFRNKFLRSHKNLRRGEGKEQPISGVPVTGVTAELLQLGEYKIRVGGFNNAEDKLQPSGQ